MQVIIDEIRELKQGLESLRQTTVAVVDEAENLLHSQSVIQSLIQQLASQREVKKHYSVEEFAKLVNRVEFTVRQWCNEGRIIAEKSMTQSGPNNRWVISRAEYERYSKEGLLPLLKAVR